MKRNIIISLLALVMIVCGVNAYNVTLECQEAGEEVLGGTGFDLSKSSLAETQLDINDTADFIFSVGSADLIDLYIDMEASTTASVLQWTYYFTDDKEEASATTWYAEDGKSVASAIATTHGASKMVHSWTPATTTQSYKNISIEPLAAERMKITFTGVTATSTISADVLRRINRN